MQITQCQTSEDGTIKWLLKTDDGQLVETVFIPEEDRPGHYVFLLKWDVHLIVLLVIQEHERLVKNLSLKKLSDKF